MNENDVLNQEQDLFADDSSDDGEDLFADFTQEESDIPTDNDVENQDTDTKEVEESNDTDSQVAGSQSQPAFMTIKYNKESKDLSKEEAIELAQKGMNYDNIYGRYESLKANEGTFDELNRLAQANNMSVQDYLKNLTDVQQKFELDKEIDALKEQYPNSDESLLEELAKAHLKDNSNIVSKKQNEEQENRKKEVARQVEIFQKVHPNVDPSKLDMSVYKLMDESGYTLTEAYDICYANEIKAQKEKQESLEKIEQQNRTNKERSLGNLSNNGVEAKDEFLSELFSDI